MSDTAKSGFITEDLVVGEFKQWKTSKIADGWLKVMGFDHIQSVDAKTTRSMGVNGKADVLVIIDGKKTLGVSVKKIHGKLQPNRQTLD